MDDEQLALTRRDQLRISALKLAVENADPNRGDAGIVQHFYLFFGLLVASGAVELNGAVTVTDAAGNVLSKNSGGEKIMTDMNVDQTATITVDPEDDHGNETADQITWTTDDNGSIGSLAVAADTHSAVFSPNNPGGEGTVVITASDPSAPNLAPFTATLNIGPGGTTQLSGSVTVA